VQDLKALVFSLIALHFKVGSLLNLEEVKIADMFTDQANLNSYTWNDHDQAMETGQRRQSLTNRFPYQQSVYCRLLKHDGRPTGRC